MQKLCELACKPSEERFLSSEAQPQLVAKRELVDIMDDSSHVEGGGPEGEESLLAGTKVSWPSFWDCWLDRFSIIVFKEAIIC